MCDLIIIIAYHLFFAAHFISFAFVFKRYLEQRDKAMHKKAKEDIRVCYEKSKSGDPQFKSITESMKVRLRATVGEMHWKKAHDYLNNFLKDKGRKGQKSMRVLAPPVVAPQTTIPTVKPFQQSTKPQPTGQNGQMVHFAPQPTRQYGQQAVVHHHHHTTYSYQLGVGGSNNNMVVPQQQQQQQRGISGTPDQESKNSNDDSMSTGGNNQMSNEWKNDVMLAKQRLAVAKGVFARAKQEVDMAEKALRELMASKESSVTVYLA